jgi:spermidine synthase
MENAPLRGDRIIGTHYIIDLFGCNRKQVNSVPFLKKTLAGAIEGTDIVLLNDSFYKFDPQGVTGFFLLSTSHMSVHSWPEYEYLSIDVYSCSSEAMTRKVVNALLEKIQHRKAVVKNIDRTYNLIPNVANDVLEMPVYKNGEIHTVSLTKHVAHIISVFQDIEIVDTKEFGRALIIDQLMQTSEKDHVIYDTAILTPVRPTDHSIIILGGGDGYVAEEALRKNPDLLVTIVDIDVEVVHAAKFHLGQKIFDHPNVTLHIGDALQYLRARKEDPVDGIVFDLTDNPTLDLEETYAEDYKRFFQKMLPLSKKHLREKGWVSVQSGASQVTDSYLDTAAIMEQLLPQHFKHTKRSDILIPSFGEENCFIAASDELL